MMTQHYGCFLKGWYPQNTPKWGKPMVVGYHHFRKPPSGGFFLQTSVLRLELPIHQQLVLWLLWGPYDLRLLLWVLGNGVWMSSELLCPQLHSSTFTKRFIGGLDGAEFGMELIWTDHCLDVLAQMNWSFIDKGVRLDRSLPNYLGELRCHAIVASWWGTKNQEGTSTSHGFFDHKNGADQPVWMGQLGG